MSPPLSRGTTAPLLTLGCLLYAAHLRRERDAASRAHRAAQQAVTTVRLRAEQAEARLGEYQSADGQPVRPMGVWG